MFSIIALWSHATVAALFGFLAIWGARDGVRNPVRRGLAIACALTACWGLIIALFGHSTPVSQFGEAARNFGWLWFMYCAWRHGGGEQRALTMLTLYITLGVVIVLCLIAGLIPSLFLGSPRLLSAVFFASILLDLMLVTGALMLVHNLYIAATNDGRTALRLPLITLAVIWIYDLNLFTISYLAGDWSYELMAMRGVAVAMTAPFFALSIQQADLKKISLSRSATFQSLSLIAISAYLVVMVLVSSLLNAVAGEYARLAQVTFVFGSSLVALVVIPTPQFRAWFRVKLSKHLFQHRYDYRAEWLRFNDTIGKPAGEDEKLDTRIIRGLADITESPSGLLLVPDDGGALTLQAQWNWHDGHIPAVAASASNAQYLAKSGRIIQLDTLRKDGSNIKDIEEAQATPEWLLHDLAAWVMVPLLHFDRLAGVVVLHRPYVDRTLDWEDFDLLRVVGRQLASYMAEARGQEALADAQQFEEFNRRFAFIMHDIKNLVSQLTLVTRNAEKHADNPEFQRDMVATLKSSTARMNEMLARLSQHNKVQTADPAPHALGPIVEHIASTKRIGHPVVISGELELYAITDPARLTQAMGHLVQNAIDASPSHEPVIINVKRIDNECLIEIEDHGVGMSTNFIRNALFKPFSSTKDAGFGIGAFESRALIMAMGGRLDVSSREGEGTVFRICLPLARGPHFDFSDTPSLTKAA